MASSIMGDTAITALRQKEHLVLEGVGAQRPAVTEDNRLSLAPVLVIDLRSIFGRDRTHFSSSSKCLLVSLVDRWRVPWIFGWRQAESHCRLYQVGERFSLHLLHHFSSVSLYR